MNFMKCLDVEVAKLPLNFLETKKATKTANMKCHPMKKRNPILH